jgi:hypothetical protein
MPKQAITPLISHLMDTRFMKLLPFLLLAPIADGD